MTVPEIKHIETPRLLLRELTPEVITHVLTNYSDEELKSFFGHTDEELQAEKERYRKGLTTYRLSYQQYLLIEKSTGVVIGKAGYHTWYLEHYKAEIGYALKDDAYKNKGYMSEALQAIMNIGFTQMNLNRIEASVGPDNTASLRLMEKFGFVREGLFRQHYYRNGMAEDSVCFSLLGHEYLPDEPVL